MSEGPAFLDGPLTTSYTFEESDPSLKFFKTIHVNQVSRWEAVLGNQYGFFVTGKFGKQFRGLPFQGGY
jgi:hypothetical protein